MPEEKRQRLMMGMTRAETNRPFDHALFVNTVEPVPQTTPQHQVPHFVLYVQKGPMERGKLENSSVPLTKQQAKWLAEFLLENI